MAEYLQPIPLSWVQTVLQDKTARKERYSQQDAVQSLLLDLLRGHERDKAAYARMWGWSRSTLYDNWASLNAEADRQRRFYKVPEGVKTDENAGHPAGHSPDTEATRNRGYQAGNAESATLAGHPAGHSPDTILEESLDREGEEEVVVVTARERFGFLSDDEWGRYGAAVQEADGKYSGFQDRYFYRVFGDSRDTVGRDMMLTMVRDEGWPKVCAALTILAMSKPARERSLNYASGIISNWNNGNIRQPQATIHRLNPARQKPSPGEAFQRFFAAGSASLTGSG